MDFLLNFCPQLNFHLFFTPTRESHSTHLGERNTLEKAKTIGLWLGMENEIKKYVRSCPICQLQETKRIKNIEKIHSTLVNLIKTSTTGNNKQWDENLKYIHFVINTTTIQTTGHSPYELTFRRTPNIPSTVNTSANLTYEDLIRKWKKKHEEIISKTRERI